MDTIRRASGFTLIEMMVFVGIFAIAMAAFMAVFTTVASVAVRQSSTAEVNSQSQFLLQTFQHYVERSSLVDMSTDVSGTTLRLRMASSNEDPVVFTLNSGRVRLQVGSAAAQDLTSSKVVVSDLQFTKRANTGGRDSVAVSFVVSAATANPGLRFSRALQTGVARVSAATFDSNLVPSVSQTYQLGASAGDWRSINNTVYFNGSNVGVGVTAPSKTLQVSGGDVYVDTSGNGIIFKDGTTCHRLRVLSGGGIATTSVPCT